MTWEQGGQTVRLRQETSYPAAETTDLSPCTGTPAPLPTPPASPRLVRRIRSAPQRCTVAGRRRSRVIGRRSSASGNPAIASRPACRWSCAWSRSTSSTRGAWRSCSARSCSARTKPAAAAPSTWRRAPRSRRDWYAKGRRSASASWTPPRAPLPLPATFFRLPGVLALLDLLRPRRRAALLNQHGPRGNTSTAPDFTRRNGSTAVRVLPGRLARRRDQWASPSRVVMVHRPK